MRWRSVGRTACSVARALSIVGERWTMLILREAFLGRRRFDDFQAGTGIARNILSARLKTLVEHGIFDRTESERDGHVEYRLTTKGIDLYPVMVALLRWGDRWMAGEEGPPMRLRHRGCGQLTTPTFACSHCGAPLDAHGVIAIPSSQLRPARKERSVARRPTGT